MHLTAHIYIVTWTVQVADQYCTHLYQVNTQLFLHRNFEEHATKFTCLLLRHSCSEVNRLFVINRNPPVLGFCMTKAMSPKAFERRRWDNAGELPVHHQHREFGNTAIVPSERFHGPYSTNYMAIRNWFWRVVLIGCWGYQKLGGLLWLPLQTRVQYAFWWEKYSSLSLTIMFWYRFSNHFVE